MVDECDADFRRELAMCSAVAMTLAGSAAELLSFYAIDYAKATLGQQFHSHNYGAGIALALLNGRHV